MTDSGNTTLPAEPNEPTVVKFDGPKHTPGPWTFDTISMETGDYGVSQRDLRISICHVHNAASFGDFITGALKRGGGRFEQSDAHTQMANALLIAAAPEMLDRLKKTNDNLRQLPGGDDPDGVIGAIIRRNEEVIGRAVGARR